MTTLNASENEITDAECKELDCVVCGSCTVDVLAHPVNLHQPIGIGKLHRVEPITLSVGGIVSNASITMSRLGMRVACFSAVGNDHWGEIVCQQYSDEGIIIDHLRRHPTMPTSTSVVMIDDQGDRSFIHCQGAAKSMTKRDYLDSLDLFAKSRSMLIGYYPLMPNLLDDLADVLAAVRETGCMTALDAAGDGGTLQPLDQILPHVDVYFPSIREAAHQTGLNDPEAIIAKFRALGAPHWIGIKLGHRGAVISPSPGETIHIDPIRPPGPIVDTTGAGDAFFGGLLTGILNGKAPQDAGNIAAATGALSVTAAGATTAATDQAGIETLIAAQCPEAESARETTSQNSDRS
tara:strand:- start:223724 stop:224773 length:1050 start_codon:yes stop_codon:yes gene_type:complete